MREELAPRLPDERDSGCDRAIDQLLPSPSPMADLITLAARFGRRHSFEGERTLYQEGRYCRLICNHFRTLHKVVTKFTNLGIEDYDLFNEGFLIYLGAVMCWEPNLKLKGNIKNFISSFVHRTVSVGLMAHVNGCYGLENTDENLELVRLYRESFLELSDRKGRPPTIEEVRGRINKRNREQIPLVIKEEGEAVDKIAAMQAAFNRVPLSTASEAEDYVEKKVFCEVLKGQIGQVVGTLDVDRNGNPLRLGQVIRERFELDGCSFQTLEQLARRFGVTAERVRQMEADALKRLRHPYRSRLLKDYITD